MIAFAGALRLMAGQQGDAAIQVRPRWDMASLPPVSLAPVA
jgi:N6-L-threonylcarbamoyladenine synthase